jgi:hypothetical protein
VKSSVVVVVVRGSYWKVVNRRQHQLHLHPKTLPALAVLQTWYPPAAAAAAAAPASTQAQDDELPHTKCSQRW